MHSAKSKNTQFFYGYIIVLVALFILAVAEGTLYSFGVFLKPLATDFGWTRAETAGAFSIFLVINGLLFILTGKLNDRFGPRVVVTVCSLLLGLGYMLMSQVSAVWQLYLFHGVIIAMGESGYWVPLPSTVARWFVKRRGTMTGIAVAGVGLGTLIIPPITSQLIASYGWRTSYLISGITALVLIMSAAQFLKRAPSQMGLSPYGESAKEAENLSFDVEGASLSQALSTKQFWMLGAMYFCFGFSLLTIMAHIVPHTTDIGIPDITAASILSIIGGTSIVGRIGIGSASDKIGNKLSLIISFVLLSAVFFWLLIAKELWMLYLFAVIFGFTYGGLATLTSISVAELFGIRAHGTILGTINFIYYGGCAVGSFVAGHIFDITNSYYLAFQIAVALSVTGLLLATLLKPPKTS